MLCTKKYEKLLPFKSTWILNVFQQLSVGENCSYKAEKGFCVSPLPCSQARLGHPRGSFPGEEQATVGDANPRAAAVEPHGYGSPDRLQLCAAGPLSACLFETALV